MPCGRRTRRRIACFLIAAQLASLGSLAWAGPEGGVVVGGTASIDQSSPGLTTVTQSSPRAIVNWSSFSTAANETVRFAQPGASAVVLNRVTGGGASVLDGALQANGRVFVLNPNGILFGAGAQVNVGGLVASTLQMSSEDFMAGRDALAQSPGHRAAAVVNRGTIRTAAGGAVALIAPVVENQGAIEAPAGRVSLAAGTRAIVSLDGGHLVNLVASQAPRQDVDAPEAWVSEAVRSSVNNSHIVEAGSVTVQDGVVTLGGGEGLAVNSGTVSANGAPGTKAGTVRVEGAQSAALTGTGRLHADGAGAASDGGDVRLIGARAAVAARGSEITARGGESGDGGAIEISADSVTPTASFDARATDGQNGTILIDPTNLRIIDGASTGDDLSVSDVNSMLSAGDTTLQATDSITFANTLDISNAGNGNDLTFQVTVNAGGIKVDPAVVGHGRILLSGSGSLLVMDAGLGFIDLYDAPTEGGTNFVVGSFSGIASGNVRFGNAEAPAGTFTARSINGDVLTGPDGFIEGGSLISLRSRGHIANSSLGQMTVRSNGGTLRLDNADHSNTPGNLRFIRVTDLTTPSTLDVDMTVSQNGQSLVDIRGQNGSTQLLLHNLGVLSGIGMSGAGKFIDFQSGSTANYQVQGLTAGKVRIANGGGQTLVNLSADDPGPNGDLILSAGGGGFLIDGGASVTAADTLSLSCGGDIQAIDGTHLLTATNISLTSVSAGVGEAGPQQIRTSTSGTLSASAAGAVLLAPQGNVTVGTISSGASNVTINGGGGVANPGSISAAGTLTVNANGAIAGAGTFTGNLVRLNASGIGSIGAPLNLSAPNMDFNAGGSLPGDIFIFNAGAVATLQNARTTSGEISIVNDLDLTVTGLVEAQNGAPGHLVRLQANTGGRNITIDGAVRSAANSGDVNIMSGRSILGSGTIEGETVTLFAPGGGATIGTSLDPLDVDSANLLATLDAFNSDFFVNDGGGVFTLSKLDLTIAANDFTSTQVALTGGRTFVSDAAGRFDGSSAPANLVLRNTGGGFILGEISTVDFVGDATGPIGGSAGVLHASSVDLFADGGIGTAASPVLLDTLDLTADNSASGPVEIRDTGTLDILRLTNAGDYTKLLTGGTLTVQAGPGVSAGTGDVILATSGGSLGVGAPIDASAGGAKIDLSAGGSINGAGLLTAGDLVTLTASTSIGNTTRVEVNAPNLDIMSAGATLVRANQALMLRSISTGAGSFDAQVSSNQSLTIGSVTAGGTVVVDAGAGALVDDGNAATKVSGTTMNLTGGAGLGSMPAHLQTAAAQLSLSSASGSIYIDEQDGAILGGSAGAGQTLFVDGGTASLVLNSVVAPGGTIELHAGTNIADNNGGTGNLVGALAILTAASGIGAGDALEATISTVDAQSTQGNIEIADSSGGLVVTRASTGAAAAGSVLISTAGGTLQIGDGMGSGVMAPGDPVSLSTTIGGITDGNGSSLDIASSALTLSAGNGIGAADALEIDATSIDGMTLTGDVRIAEQNGVTIARLQTGTAGSAGDGQIFLDVLNGGLLALGDGTDRAVRAELDPISIFADGGIVDGNAGVNVVGSSVQLDANAGVGTALDLLDVDAATLDASITGDVYLADPNSVTLGTIGAGAVFRLDAAGSILDDTLTGTRVTAGGAVLNAGGAAGAPGGGGHLDLTVGTLDAGVGTDLYVQSNAMGQAITAGTISAGGTVSIDVFGELRSDGAGVDITASVADLSGFFAIGDPLVPLTTSVTTLFAFADGGAVTIKESSGLTASIVRGEVGVDITALAGDLTAGAISSNLGAVRLEATTGAIKDDGAATRLVAQSVDLDAATGVGAVGLPVQTTTGGLAATTTNGIIELHNVGAVTVYGLQATGTGGVVELDATGAVTLAAGSAATGLVRIGAAGDITDASGGVDVTGATVTLATTLGSIGEFDSIDTTAGTLNASAPGTVRVDETDAVTIGNVSSAGDTVEIANQAGDITLGYLGSPTTVAITTDTGSLVDGDGDLDVSATELVLNLSLDAGVLDPIDTSIGKLSTLAGGDIFIDNAGGITLESVANIASLTLDNAGTIVVKAVDAPAVSLTATSGGSILEGTAGVLDLTAITSIALTAAGSIGAPGTPLFTSTPSLSFSAGNGVYLQQSGDVTLDGVNVTGAFSMVAGGNVTVGGIAATGAVDIDAGGDIQDDGDGMTRVSGTTVTFTAASVGVGDAVETTTGALGASVTGDLVVDELDAVTLTGVSAGSVTLTAGGQVTAGQVAVASALAVDAGAAGAIVEDGNAATSLNAAAYDLRGTSVGAGTPLTLAGGTITAVAGTGDVGLSVTGGADLALVSAAMGNVTVSAGAAMTVGDASAAGTIALNAPAINDDGNAATRLAATLANVAADDIGGSSPLQTDVAILDASAATGGLAVDERDAIQLRSVTVAGRAAVANLGGDIAVDTLSASTIELTAPAGAIAYAGSQPQPALVATFATLDASGGIGGPGAPVIVSLGGVDAVSSGGEVHLATSGGLDVVRASGTAVGIAAGQSLTIGAVTAGGAVTLSAGADVTDGGGTPVTGASLAVTAGTDVRLFTEVATIDVAAGGRVDVTQARSLDALRLRGADVRVSVFQGDLSVTDVVAGNVDLMSAGAIRGGGQQLQQPVAFSPPAPDISAATVSLVAAGPIGDPAVPLETSADLLRAESSGGGVFVHELTGLAGASLFAFDPAGRVELTVDGGDLFYDELRAGSAVSVSVIAGGLAASSRVSTGLFDAPIEAPSVSLAASGAISSGGVPVTVRAEVLDVTAGGSASVREIDGVQLRSFTAGGRGRFIDEFGDVALGTARAGDELMLESRFGSITDGNESAMNIEAARVALYAGGTIGKADALEVNVGALGLLARGADSPDGVELVSARLGGMVSSGHLVAIESSPGSLLLDGAPASLQQISSPLYGFKVDPAFVAAVYGEAVAQEAARVFATLDKAGARALYTYRLGDGFGTRRTVDSGLSARAFDSAISSALGLPTASAPAPAPAPVPAPVPAPAPEVVATVAVAPPAPEPAPAPVPATIETVTASSFSLSSMFGGSSLLFGLGGSSIAGASSPVYAAAPVTYAAPADAGTAAPTFASAGPSLFGAFGGLSPGGFGGGSPGFGGGSLSSAFGGGSLASAFGGGAASPFGFGGSLFGVSSFGVSSFGVSSFGVSSFGVSSFGVSPFGVSSFGVSSFGGSPGGSLLGSLGGSTFGATSYGGLSLGGATGYTAPAIFGTAATSPSAGGALAPFTLTTSSLASLFGTAP